MAKKKKSKDKKDSGAKPVSGLMAGLVNAGFMSEKQVRGVKRGHRKERKEARAEHGHKGIEALEAAKARELKEQLKQSQEESRSADQKVQRAQRKERILELRRRGLAVGGRRRFYFVRADRVIDFVDVDDGSQGALCRRELGVADGPDSGDEYRLLPIGGLLDELRQIAPELILFPAS